MSQLISTFILLLISGVQLARCSRDFERALRLRRCPMQTKSQIAESGAVQSEAIPFHSDESEVEDVFHPAGYRQTVFQWEDPVSYTFTDLDIEDQQKLQSKWNEWKLNYRAAAYQDASDQRIITIFKEIYPKLVDAVRWLEELIKVPDRDENGVVRLWRMDQIALKLYTDLDEKCTALRASFRLNCSPNTAACRANHIFWNDALKQAFRHYNEYYIHLRKSPTLPTSTVYHGMHSVCIDFYHFVGKSVTIHGPLSTTKVYQVAYNFGAGIGIVLELKPTYHGAGFTYPIDINSIIINKGTKHETKLSKHSDESELLFYGGNFMGISISTVFKHSRHDNPMYLQCKTSIEGFEAAPNKQSHFDRMSESERGRLESCYIDHRYGSTNCWQTFWPNSYNDVQTVLHSVSKSYIDYKNEYFDDNNKLQNHEMNKQIWEYRYKFNNYDDYQYFNDMEILIDVGLAIFTLLFVSMGCLVLFCGFIIIYKEVYKKNKHDTYTNNNHHAI